MIDNRDTLLTIRWPCSKKIKKNIVTVCQYWFRFPLPQSIVVRFKLPNRRKLLRGGRRGSIFKKKIAHVGGFYIHIQTSGRLMSIKLDSSNSKLPPGFSDESMNCIKFEKKNRMKHFLVGLLTLGNHRVRNEFKWNF